MSWYDEDVINSFMCVMNKHTKNMYFSDSWFVCRLEKYFRLSMDEDVKKLCSHLRERVLIETLDKWLIPISVENIHWKLVVVFPNVNVMMMYDPHQRNRSLQHVHELDRIRSFLIEYGKQHNIENFHTIPWLSIHEECFCLDDDEVSKSGLYILKASELNLLFPKDVVTKITIPSYTIQNENERILQIIETGTIKPAQSLRNNNRKVKPISPTKSRYKGQKGKGLSFVLDPTLYCLESSFNILAPKKKRKLMHLLMDQKNTEDSSGHFSTTLEEMKNCIIWESHLPLEPLQHMIAEYCSHNVIANGYKQVCLVSFVDDSCSWRDPLLFERMILETLYSFVEKTTLCIISKKAKKLPNWIVPSEDYNKHNCFFMQEQKEEDLYNLITLNDSIYQLKTHLFQDRYLDVVVFESLEEFLCDGAMEKMGTKFAVTYNDDPDRSPVDTDLFLNICISQNDLPFEESQPAKNRKLVAAV